MSEKKNNSELEFELSQTSKDEREILDFWNKNKIFEKSLEQREKNKKFVFYDGPPFATGLPHYGHITPGTIKDVIPRYKSMKGYFVERKWGWDCHGMPIENIVEKKHNLNSKKNIEEFGIDNFCKSASESIFSYKKEWEEIIPRTGRWVDMKNHYKTMDSTYTESVWWAFSEFYKKGLVSKDFKSMHICPRCETTLSNRDVSEGYKDIKDLSLVAKFPLKNEEDAYILAWTTTPWTLPGNVALAVGKDIEYSKVAFENEKYILAKDLVEKHFKDKEYKIIESFKGSDLIGFEYEPLFDYYFKNKELENRENGWKIYGADFVTTEEGTGIVHIAPAFGEDDMNLGKEKKLPFVQHVKIDGSFKDEVIDFKGLKVRKKDFHEEADIEIIKFLASKGLLFHKEKYEHSYPHCWRCDTPLLNYATSSWFINVPKFRDELVRENEKIFWVPEYIGKKRFANWLSSAKPWAISRSRYWGTPIPIWENKDSDKFLIFGSLKELREKTSKNNKYVLFRHAQSEANVSDILSHKIGHFGDKITLEGKKQAEKGAEKISEFINGEQVDYIFASPFVRTKETAEIIKNKYPEAELIFDDRLVETDFGSKNYGFSNDIYRNWKNKEWAFDKKILKEGESFRDIKKRMMEFISEIEEKYENKNIVIVSHQLPLYILSFAVRGQKEEEFNNFISENKEPENANPFMIEYSDFPHDENWVLDFHRPYIDRVVIREKGEEYKFIGDVFDTWFDSGSMPFASKHYPFKKDSFDPEKDLNYPADFISEGLDQTRGWFYVLLVINYVLFGKTPFKRVIVHGMLMAEDGKKMSKSLRNYPPVEEVLSKYGADALRLFLLTSSIVKGDSPSFHEKIVDEINKKVVMRSKNILSFYEIYKNKKDGKYNPYNSKNILDKWILKRTEKLIEEVTKGLEKYELDDAARHFFDYVDDLSTWYLRRSRDRFKGDDVDDRNYALVTLERVLKDFAKTIAPFAPFLADYIWKGVRNENDEISVHLTDWPENKKTFLSKIFKNNILEEMKDLREIISGGLENRLKNSLKVRQPLRSILIISSKLKNKEEFLEIIKDELNVKEVYLFSDLKSAKIARLDEFSVELNDLNEEVDNFILLNKNIDDELKKEGDFREFLRQVQILRKNNKMKVEDEIEIKVDLMDSEDKSFIEDYLEELKKIAGVKKVNFGKIEKEGEVKINDKKIKIILIK